MYEVCAAYVHVGVRRRERKRAHDTKTATKVW